MTIRSTSMLQQATSLGQQDLIEISHAYDGKYISQKTQLSALRNEFTKTISATIADTFSLYQNATSKTPINVQQLSSAVLSVYNKNIKLAGEKTFTSIPTIQIDQNRYVGKPDSAIPNIGKVKDLIDSRACFVGDDYLVHGDIGGDRTVRSMKICNDAMIWHFDDNTQDSTEWKNPEMNNQKTTADGVICTRSGYLTMYGWLADNGIVLAQDCWVGLYGYINTMDDDTGEAMPNWVLLQMQPWIKGQNASQLQYVGFNIPVKAGLRLKIRTGFKVNGNVGAFQDSSSQTAEHNMPNTFIGYIMNSGD